MTHPVIRVLLLAVLAAGLARAGLHDLLLAGSLLAVAYLVLGFHHWQRFVRMALRLRIFYASIAVIYLWFTPGELIWPILGEASPSWAGLWLGLQRVLALVLLVAAVQLLLELTSRAELLAAVAWWARPLRVLGVSSERLGLRMVLALETLPRLRALVQRPTVGPAGERLQRLAGYAADTFERVLDEAERAELPAVEVPVLARPGWWQWLMPLLLAAALWYL